VALIHYEHPEVGDPPDLLPAVNHEEGIRCRGRPMRINEGVNGGIGGSQSPIGDFRTLSGPRVAYRLLADA
jgi:hypothetical protein